MAGRGRRNADDVLALELAAGREVADAAKRAGIGERTAYRRLADAGFRRRVLTLRGEMTDRALGKLADAGASAVETLRGLLAATGESTRLGAARAILEIGNKLREAVEMEERISNLERSVNVVNDGA